MNVWVVTRNPGQLRALTEALQRRYENLSVAAADSALFALTGLERDLPDLIISAAEVGMRGAEFLEIVRDDALLKEVPFILLDETALEHFTPGAHEIVLEERASPATVSGVATSLLARRLKEAAGAPPRTCLQGATELVSPFALLTLLAGETSTGRLTFDLSNRAVLQFAEGRLVHAEYEQADGEAALVETFRALQGGSVRFEYRPAEDASGRVTLDQPLQVLLLKVALELDRASA